MTTKTTTKTQEVQAVVYETADGQVNVQVDERNFVEKPSILDKGVDWVDEHIVQRHRAKKAEKAVEDKPKKRIPWKAIGIGGLAVVGTVLAAGAFGSKSEDDQSESVLDDHYLDDSSDDCNDADYYVEESVEVTEEI